MQGGVLINRAQKRKMMKKLGVDYSTMNLIADAVEHQSETELHNGDRVTIDTDTIMSKKHFPNMQPAYQEFVRNSVGQVFTVVKEERFEGKPIVSLLEDTREVRWLFWEGELIRVKEEHTDEKI